MAKAAKKAITKSNVIPFPAPKPPPRKTIWVEVDEEHWLTLIRLGKELGPA